MMDQRHQDLADGVVMACALVSHYSGEPVEELAEELAEVAVLLFDTTTPLERALWVREVITEAARLKASATGTAKQVLRFGNKWRAVEDRGSWTLWRVDLVDPKRVADRLTLAQVSAIVEQED